MKKLLLIAAVAVFGFTNVNAQDDKTVGGFAEGDFYASGSIGYNSTEVGDFDVNSFTFSPSVGYFINENIALEATLIFGSSETTADFEGDSVGVDNSTFGGGLGATYFFTPSNQFSFTIGAGASYTSTKSEFDVDGSEELTTNTFGIAVAPGVNYFISECIALRASVGALSYTSSKLDVDGAESVNSFNINMNLTDINFAITFKL